MIYQFILLSDEVNDFARAINIDSEATFFDLHKAILNSVNYSDKEMTTFFICSEEWEKETEITLMDMGISSELDSWIMDQTKLDEFLDEEKQRLLYTFDLLSERSFFIELHKISTGKSLEKAICTGKKGEAPIQAIDYDTLVSVNPITSEIGEDFYGSDGYNDDELDTEGYIGLDSIEDIGYSDDRY